MHGFDREQWEQVDAIFAAALERMPEEREAFIEEACSGEPGLRARVERLLVADAAAERVLGDSAADFATPFLATGDSALTAGDSAGGPIPERIGPYRIVRELGRGGMGTVYLAEKSDAHYDRTVALKVVKRGMDTDEILRRFRSERQILASLEHPNIARLYDGGMTADGRPYLVMEYVQGEPIDRYCDDHDLGVRARLELFGQVAEAVQAAHQHLVVHRDLKPGNTLVHDGSGGPAVKLLDFGLAKVLVADSIDPAEHDTRPGMQLMSPHYASPEHVRGEALSTTSDIYSLGIILHELLTGQRPYEFMTCSLAEMARVMEQPLRRPSTRVPEPRAALLRGDLDCIVLRALDREPRRRYPTAAELHADIRRHLDDEPVRARLPSHRYRLHKFVRRNRVIVLAGLFVLTALVVAVVGTTSGWRTAQDARELAQQEAETSAAINQFLIDMFAAPDPWAVEDAEGAGRDVRVVEVMNRAAEALGEAFVDRPVIKAALQSVIGRTYRNLGRWDDAEPLLVSALRTRERVLGSQHEATLAALNELAVLRRFQGRNVDAKRLFERLQSAAHATLGPQDALTLQAAGEVLNSMAGLGDPRGARDAYPDLIARQRRALGDDHPLTLASLQRLGSIYLELGELRAAEPYLREAHDGRRRVFGDDHPQTVRSSLPLADLYRQTDRVDQAEHLFIEALAIHRRMFGEDHSSTLELMTTLGRVMYSQGHLDDAAALFGRVLDIRRRVLGPDDPVTISTLANLGTLLMKQERFAEARPLMEEAAARSQSNDGPDHPSTLHCQHNLGMILLQVGEQQQAERVLRETVRARMRVLGPESLLTLSSMHNLAHACGLLDDWPEAVRIHREVLAARTALMGLDHPDTLVSMNALATALMQSGSPGEAEPLFVELVNRAGVTLPQDSWLRHHFKAGHGRCLLRMGRYDLAEAALINAFEGLKAEFGVPHPKTQVVLHDLVQVCEALGMPEPATAFRALIASPAE